MSESVALERVIVVPRNGYANRLQAWASSAILAAQLDVPLHVFWEPEHIAPATASDLFAARLRDRSFIDSTAFQGLVGKPHTDLPRYLSIDATRGTMVLAGHDRGEQAFMPEVASVLAQRSSTSTLVIVAGGKFHLPAGGDFLRQRRVFYQSLEWSVELDARVAALLADRPQYAALHIRSTDRSREAPTRRTVLDGLRQLGAAVETRDLFVAADSDEARAGWADRAATLGFRPWWSKDVDFDRTSAAAGLAALADWRVLAGAEAIVHPAASTFSAEAAVASGHADRAVALTATSARQRARATADLARAALTYPARRRNATDSHASAEASQASTADS